MLSQGASKVNISLVVKMKDKDTVIKALHDRFFEIMRREREAREKAAQELANEQAASAAPNGDSEPTN